MESEQTVIVPVSTPRQAWTALRMNGLPQSLRSELLWLIAHSNDVHYAYKAWSQGNFRLHGLPDATELRAAFVQILLKARSGQFLRDVMLYERPPQGTFRSHLLEVIETLPGLSFHMAISAGYRLTAEETERLSWAALKIRNLDMRAKRAERIMRYFKERSPELRAVLLKTIMESRYVHEVVDVLEHASEYFAVSAPMTCNERAMLLKAIPKNSYNCLRLLRGLDGVMAQVNPSDLKLDPTEMTELIPGALDYIADGGYSMVAKDLLERSDVVALLTDEQQQQLEKLSRRNAA